MPMKIFYIISFRACEISEEQHAVFRSHIVLEFRSRCMSCADSNLLWTSISNLYKASIRICTREARMLASTQPPNSCLKES